MTCYFCYRENRAVLSSLPQRVTYNTARCTANAMLTTGWRQFTHLLSMWVLSIILILQFACEAPMIIWQHGTHGGLSIHSVLHRDVTNINMCVRNRTRSCELCPWSSVYWLLAVRVESNGRRCGVRLVVRAGCCLQVNIVALLINGCKAKTQCSVRTRTTHGQRRQGREMNVCSWRQCKIR